MPQQTKTSKLGAKYGNKANQAVVSHADDETTYGFIALPAGITNGIAQLQQAYFEQYKEGDNKGEYYFRASGVVIEPTAPVPTKTGPMIVTNLTTSIMVPFCETRYGGKVTPMEDNISRIMLEMRRLGGPEYTNGATVDDLEDLAAGLEELAPIFKFSTTVRIAQKDVPEKNVKKGDVLEGCFENWHGCQGLEDYEPPAPKQAKVKSGGAAASEVKASANGSKDKQSDSGRGGKPAAAGKSPTNRLPKQETPPKEEAPPPPDDDDDQGQDDGEVDLDALAADAADQDSETQEASGDALIQAAVDAGLDEEWARNEAKSWEEVVEAIREKQNENGDGDPDPDADQVQIPKVGEEMGYCPVNPKTKKPVTTPVKCEIVKVDEKNETVDLKAGKAAYKGIGWSELVEL